jgi:hypothetical protein
MNGNPSPVHIIGRGVKPAKHGELRSVSAIGGANGPLAAAICCLK